MLEPVRTARPTSAAPFGAGRSTSGGPGFWGYLTAWPREKKASPSGPGSENGPGSQADRSAASLFTGGRVGGDRSGSGVAWFPRLMQEVGVVADDAANLAKASRISGSRTGSQLASITVVAGKRRGHGCPVIPDDAGKISIRASHQMAGRPDCVMRTLLAPARAGPKPGAATGKFPSSRGASGGCPG